MSSDANYTFTVTANRTLVAKFGNDVNFIAVGANGCIYTTNNGVVSYKQLGNNYWFDIAYGNGKYVAVGGRTYNMTLYLTDAAIAISTDGVNWTYTPQPFPSGISGVGIKSIVYGNGKFVISSDSGSFSTSTDGINWTTPTSQAIYHTTYVTGYTLQFGGGYFFGLSSSAFLTSLDGVIWSIPYASSAYVDGVYGNGKYLLCCNRNPYNLRYGTDITKIHLSNYAESKSVSGTGNSTFWTTCTFANGLYVIAGRTSSPSPNKIFKACISISTDCVTWITPIEFGEYTWKNINYIDGKFIVISDKGHYSTSIDGIIWTTPTQIKDENGNALTVDLRSVCAINN